jgi:glycosyltransferase involved in cell wall biosynthesis
MTILAIAYACEPGEGSEPGAGWAWARALAQIDQTVVITRANNQSAIEKGLVDCPQRDRLEFVYVDLPAWMRFWKRGQRGLRLYYLLWQIAVLMRARTIQRSQEIDLVWHITIANAWLGSVGGMIGPTFVYGPVGGAVAPPRRLLSVLGTKGFVYEILRSLARGWGRFANPLARIAWRKADLILVQNRETRDWFPERYRRKVEVFPNVLVEGNDVLGKRDRIPGRVAVFAGRLLAWKGCALAIDSLAFLPGWKLIICGRGPDEQRLRARTVKRGVQERVEFRGWLSRERLLDLMATETDVFLFPSLHDEAGWVVHEARASGLPTVCLDVGGPPLLGGRAVRPSGPEETAKQLAAKVQSEVGSIVEPPPTLEERVLSLRVLLGHHGLFVDRNTQPLNDDRAAE